MSQEPGPAGGVHRPRGGLGHVVQQTGQLQEGAPAVPVAHLGGEPLLCFRRPRCLSHHGVEPVGGRDPFHTVDGVDRMAEHVPSSAPGAALLPWPLQAQGLYSTAGPGRPAPPGVSWRHPGPGWPAARPAGARRERATQARRRRERGSRWPPPGGSQGPPPAARPLSRRPGSSRNTFGPTVLTRPRSRSRRPPYGSAVPSSRRGSSHCSTGTAMASTAKSRLARSSSMEPLSGARSTVQRPSPSHGSVTRTMRSAGPMPGSTRPSPPRLDTPPPQGGREILSQGMDVRRGDHVQVPGGHASQGVP